MTSHVMFKAGLPLPVYGRVFRIALRFLSDYVRWLNQGKYYENDRRNGILQQTLTINLRIASAKTL
jgi:hypothetical protein